MMNFYLNFQFIDSSNKIKKGSNIILTPRLERTTQSIFSSLPGISAGALYWRVWGHTTDKSWRDLHPGCSMKWMPWLWAFSCVLVSLLCIGLLNWDKLAFSCRIHTKPRTFLEWNVLGDERILALGTPHTWCHTRLGLIFTGYWNSG